MNTVSQTIAPRRSSPLLASSTRPSAPFARRERAFGVGYGSSSGYASERRYTPESGNPRFRFA